MGVSVRLCLSLCLRMSKWVYVRVVLHVCFARVLYTVMVAFAPGIKPWRWKWRWWEKKKKRKWEWELKVNNAENKLSISFNLLAARFSQRHRYKTNICKVITKASANALSLSTSIPPLPFSRILSSVICTKIGADDRMNQQQGDTTALTLTNTYVFIFICTCVCVWVRASICINRAHTGCCCYCAATFKPTDGTDCGCQTVSVVASCTFGGFVYR